MARAQFKSEPAQRGKPARATGARAVRGSPAGGVTVAAGAPPQQLARGLPVCRRLHRHRDSPCRHSVSVDFGR
ncbi:MAG: hypothetical protein KME26_31200 [Oscillatoria princeps RMCB-10]|nr:hypothetical protein [Oscillatoria princeps RMCB-10]